MSCALPCCHNPAPVTSGSNQPNLAVTYLQFAVESAVRRSKCQSRNNLNLPVAALISTAKSGSTRRFACNLILSGDDAEAVAQRPTGKCEHRTLNQGSRNGLRQGIGQDGVFHPQPVAQRALGLLLAGLGLLGRIAERWKGLGDLTFGSRTQTLRRVTRTVASNECSKTFFAH